MMNFHRIIPHQMIRTIGLILLATAFITSCASTSASKEEMSVASEQISIAKTDLNSAISAGANDYAPLHVRSAMDKISSAEKAMASEEYTRARQLAEQARLDAQLAEATARSAKAQKAADAVKEGGRILREEMER
ncbi:MAG: DUF4398 domain-containing protein [Pseudomonadota bacterium]